MNDTSQTMLAAARDGAESGWRRLDALYRPFIYGWLRSKSVPHHDADDVTQAVMLVIADKITAFEHSGNTGAFRAWIRNIVAFETKRHWRGNGARARAANGADQLERLLQVEDPDSDLTTQWNLEHDHFVLNRLLLQVETEFEANTMTAFRRTTLEALPVQQVAQELGITEGAVYIARSRVLSKLRQEATDLLGSELL